MILEHNLFINHITYGESMPPFNKNYDDYMQMAYLCLNHKGSHLFESDILSRYSEGMTLEKVFAQNPDRYKLGSMKEKDGIRQKTWYDLWGDDEIVREDGLFDYFFICKLRHQSLLDIDGYLSFHLDYSFKNQKQEFFRFLQLALRQHKEKLLNADIIETVNEWISAIEKKGDSAAPTEPDKDDKIKGRIPREAGDHLTSLNLNQTALLIEYMQQAGIILKGDYLNFTQAGKAFQMLTGYSAHSLRMQLGAKGSVEYMIKNEDYKELYAAVTKLASLIEPKTHNKVKDRKKTDNT